MRLKELKILLLFLTVVVFFSCSPKNSDIVIAEFGDYKVKMKEFEDAYAKNAGGYEKAKEDSISKLKNFLELYVNFRMKLRDAEVKGYSKNPELQAELTDYKKKIGVTYFIEKNIVDPGIKDLYEKRKYELRVSHIMFRPTPQNEDSIKSLAQAVLDSIKHGSSFEDMVKRYSTDMYSKPYGGDIYYFTAGQVPVEFETAAYKTPVGHVYPQVVKTRFGLHIIKVTEKRHRVPMIRASHILIDFRNDSSQIDTVEARAKADSILQRIKKGEDFGKLAQLYSEDPGSKQKGGDLDYFERRRMVKEFDEAAFNLDSGQVSGIVRTNFGYHIIKVTDKKKYPPFEEEKENLKNLYKDRYYQDAYNAFIDSLAKKYNYALNEKTFDKVLALSDSVKFNNDHPKLNEFKDDVIFSYAGKNLSAGELFSRELESGSDFTNKLISKDLLTKAVDKVKGTVLLEEEALKTQDKDPQFSSLMNDYRNGIYIFKLQEDEVWNKINIDSAKVYQYYLDTKEKYVWPNRISFSEIYSRNDSLIHHYYDLLKGGADFDSLAAQVTERPNLKQKKGDYGLIETKGNKLAEEADKLKEKGELSAPAKIQGGWSILRLNYKEPSRLKTYEEARAEVSNSYQDLEVKRLEQAYVDRLKKLYEPVIYYDKINKAFTEAD
ncbi:MAG TPA: peptidylprolyl isomerase [Ignavibacteriaceae bacterium]|nr:peptidylprolyl isomerase [Ignavibacteriaceae bacterium]